MDNVTSELVISKVHAVWCGLIDSPVGAWHVAIEGRLRYTYPKFFYPN